MSETSYKPRRRIGCLMRLFILVLFMGACYWLLLAPIQERGTDQGPGTATPETPSERVSVEGEVNPTQQAALEDLADETGEHVDVLAQNGQVRFLDAAVHVPDSVAVSAQEKAAYFFSQNSDLIQIQNPATSLFPAGSSTNEQGITTLRYSQRYKGIPVYNSSIVLSLGPNDEVLSFSASYVPNLELDVQPVIRSIEAETIVLSALGGGNAQLLGDTSLIIYAPEIWEPNSRIKPALCWLVFASSASAGDVGFNFIDAKNSELLDQISLGIHIEGNADIEIRDAHGWSWVQTALNDRNPFDLKKSDLTMDESGYVAGAEQNSTAQFIQQNALRVDAYYRNILNRNSYDNEGMLIKVYYNVENCWPQWVKDFPIRNNFTNENMTVIVNSIFMCPEWAENIDAMAHEFTHGVVAHSSNLGDRGEAPALNEAYADIFAAIIDDKDPWKITRDVEGTKIRRRLDNPKDLDPDFPIQYADLVKDVTECPTDEDQAPYCVHTNSTIWSHAFYRLAVGEGSLQSNSQGIALIKLQYIYYETMINLPSGADFKNAAHNTLAKCTEFSTTQRHGVTPADCEEIRWVFAGTGLVAAMTPIPPSIPSLPNLPDPSAWFDQIRESARQFFDNLFGEWSPTKLWQRFNDFIQDIRANYWVKLMECAANNDQACLNQYLLDLLNYMWSAFLEMLLKAWNNFCMNLFLIPLIGMAIRGHMRIK